MCGLTPWQVGEIRVRLALFVTPPGRGDKGKVGIRMFTRCSKNLIVLSALVLGLSCPPLFAEDAPAQAAGEKTATNVDDIDVTDTTENPDYAAAGEELAKEAFSDVYHQAAPLATMTTIDGQIINLADVYGKKPVYLKFWATWCVPCRQQMPNFEATYKKLGAQMEIIAVNVGFSDDEQSVRAIQNKFGLTMPIVIDDGTLARLFHVAVTPQHVLIGKDVRFKYMGHADNEHLENALADSLKDETDGVAQAEAAASEPRVQVGDLVHDLSVTLLGGEHMPLKAKPGRLLAVELFSTWCEWYLETSRPETSKACARVRETIEELSKSIPEVEWVGIAGGPWSTTDDLAEYKKSNNVTIPLALNQGDSLFRIFGVRDIPTIALIDDSQHLIRLIGPSETNTSEIVRGVVNATLGHDASGDARAP